MVWEYCYYTRLLPQKDFQSYCQMDAAEQVTAGINNTHIPCFWTLDFLQIKGLPLKVGVLFLDPDLFGFWTPSIRPCSMSNPSENAMLQMTQHHAGYLSNRLSCFLSSFTSKHKTFPGTPESQHGLHSAPRSICSFNVLLSEDINAANGNIMRQGLTQLHDNWRRWILFHWI